MGKLEDASAHELYRACQVGADKADLLGHGLIIDDLRHPELGVLATLARLRFIEHGLQLGAAKMLGEPLEAVVQATDRLVVTLLLQRVMAGGVTAAEATVMTSGRAEAEFLVAEAQVGKDLSQNDPTAAWQALTAAIDKSPLPAPRRARV